MINDFISDLKNSPYYDKLIINDNVLGLYIGGSTSAGTSDGNSDFDLIAITLSGDSLDTSNEIYLKYKGKTVHWYYWPLKEIFKLYNDCVWLAGSIGLRNIRPELILYTKPSYQKLWDLLLQYKEKISNLACRQLFKTMKREVSVLLGTEDLLKVQPHKCYYHLCLATGYLLNEKIDLALLQDLKSICRRRPNSISSQLVVDIIRRGLNYIETFYESPETEITNLYVDFSEQAQLLNLTGVEL